MQVGLAPPFQPLSEGGNGLESPCRALARDAKGAAGPGPQRE